MDLKIFKTVNTYFSFFSLSMAYNVTGPCLLDLQHLVNADGSHIALIYTSRSIGYLVGAVLGGIVLDLVQCKQAVLIVCHAIFTGTICGIPWTHNKESMMGVMVVNGLSLGAIETGGNFMCLRLWGKDSNPVIQGLHSIFGLGGLLVPLITAPFLENFNELSPLTENITYLEGSSFMQHDALSSSGNLTAKGIPKIVYPFSIVGAFSLLTTILFLISCILSPTEEGALSEKTNDSESSNSFLFISCILACSFGLLFVGVGTEFGFTQALTDYAVQGPLHSTSIVGSYMTSAYWAALTLNRLVSVFLSIKFGDLVLMVANTCIIIVSALILQFLMPSECALWFVSVLFGVGIASIYPSTVGILNTYIKVTNRIAALFTVAVSAGEMAVPFTMIYFMEKKPEVFTFVIDAASLLLLFLLFMLFLILKAGNKSITVIRKSKCSVIDGEE